jgi:hypothetical protein
MQDSKETFGDLKKSHRIKFYHAFLVSNRFQMLPEIFETIFAGPKIRYLDRNKYLLGDFVQVPVPLKDRNKRCTQKSNTTNSKNCNTLN